ncbi:polysaccharide deacetylase family protein [Nocardia sp. NPDC056064]|uniref:polysaccharide deacetylase family protein n=1 Tax=Nocardia sp. NPDC056064 TaxID=3345701 RepID=UPI0035DDAE3B
MIIVPILLYHSVSADPAGWIAPFAVDPPTFARHVELMAASGRTPMTAASLTDALREGRALPARPLVVTFDDGFADFADAAPVLAARHIPCTLYVTTGALRGPHLSDRLCLPPARMLAWSQLAELTGYDIEIAAHTHTHPQLDTLREQAAAAEIHRCKDLLEDATGQQIRSFAYPHGFHSPRVRRQARAAGYTGAAAVGDSFSSDADDRFALARLTVRSTTTIDELTAWLSGRDAHIAPRPEAWRTKLWRTYRRLRGPRSTRGVITLPDQPSRSPGGI